MRDRQGKGKRAKYMREKERKRKKGKGKETQGEEIKLVNSASKEAWKRTQLRGKGEEGSFVTGSKYEYVVKY